MVVNRQVIFLQLDTTIAERTSWSVAPLDLH